MKKRDLHSALKNQVLGSGKGAGVEFILVKLLWGKDDFAFSLHAAPSTYTVSGLQPTDFLGYLGFERGGCSFLKRGECYSRWVEVGFDPEAFGRAFEESFAALTKAETHLNACGFPLDQPEGWAYFTGKPPRVRAVRAAVLGDGHTAPKHQSMKRAEDDNFEFVFSWIEGGQDKGWTTHYRPKRSPISPEVQTAFKFLGLRAFDNCPEFNFERCYWRFSVFASWGESPFDSNVDEAHKWFDAHSDHFSVGVQSLLAAQAAIEKFGMVFLPVTQTPQARQEEEIKQRTVAPPPARPERKGKYDFDVAISFAGPQRELAERLATIARDAGFHVFYDNFYPAQLWGKDLPVFFDEIYRKRSRYCVIFVSSEYTKRMWTNHERQSAIARQIEQRGKEYILPVKVNDAELPGMPSTVGHLGLAEHGIDKIGKLLIEKLKQ